MPRRAGSQFTGLLLGIARATEAGTCLLTVNLLSTTLSVHYLSTRIVSIPALQHVFQYQQFLFCLFT